MKTLFRIIYICTFVVIGALGCDGDECPTCPEPDDGSYSGIAYLSMLRGFKGFYIYDTDSGAIVDSVLQPGYAAGTIVHDVSVDGRYLSVSYNVIDGIETRIYDANNKTILAALPGVGVASFVDNSRLLLARNGSRFCKYLMPSLEKVYEDTILGGSANYVISETLRSVFIVVDNHLVFQVSYDSMKVVRQWDLIDPEFNIPIFIRHFDAHPGGDYLYIVGSSAYVRFFVYDLMNDRLVSAYPMSFDFGRVKVSPNGQEVWVTDPGRIDLPFSPPEVGTVFIFDAHSGAYTGGISLYGYVPGNPLEPLDATGVYFSPDGKEAYIATGAFGARDNPGTILRFDARSRELISNIFPQVDRSPYGVVVGPRP